MYKGKNTQARQYCVQFIVILFSSFLQTLSYFRRKTFSATKREQGNKYNRAIGLPRGPPASYTIVAGAFALGINWLDCEATYVHVVPKLGIVRYFCRSQWPRGLWRRFAAARLLRLWVRIPPVALTFVCCEYCVCCQVEVSATS